MKRTKEIWNCLIDFLKNQREKSLIKWREENERHVQLQKAQLQAQAEANIYSAMMGMANDLYAVFNGRNYPNLAAVNRSDDIRIVRHGFCKGKSWFAFSISKSSDKILSVGDLTELKQLMNADILRFKTQLMYHPGNIAFYPYLADGMVIWGIRDSRYHVFVVVI